MKLVSMLFVKRRGGDYIACGLVKFERVDFNIQMTDIGTAPKPWPVFQKHCSVLYGES
jgi:hypothetical protein